jgi:hypothetical protein
LQELKSGMSLRTNQDLNCKGLILLVI